MIPSNEISKQDSLGRVRAPVERREALLSEFEKSGVTFITWVEKRQ